MIPGLDDLNAMRTSIAAGGWTEANLYLLSVKKKMQTNPGAHTKKTAIAFAIAVFLCKRKTFSLNSHILA